MMRLQARQKHRTILYILLNTPYPLMKPRECEGGWNIKRKLAALGLLIGSGIAFFMCNMGNNGLEVCYKFVLVLPQIF